MCGIAGIIEFDGKTIVLESVVTSMCEVIKYRGPDDGGVITGEGFGLGARRLAILDISPLGHMPLKSDDGRFLIVYNGEVYNFLEIKENLVKEGVLFHTGTDTEVVLKSYLFYGSKCLTLFNGMFAFVIYDTVLKKTFIARDRLGIKPLFYTILNNKITIASELKSLWEAGIPKIFNREKFGELFSFRYIAGDETIYGNIYKLLPGHYMEISGSKIEFHKWWDLKDFALNEEKRPSGKISDWYRQTFDDSVKLRKISDVPVGVLLSGGLDSSSVAASLAGISKDKLSSFTVRFKEAKYDEGDLARLVANKFNLDYNELYLSDNDVYSKMIETIKENDEPIFHGSDLFVKEISAFAKSKVTVLLSGEGGDETLGGYIRYMPLRKTFILKLGFAFRSFLNLLPAINSRVSKLIRMLSLGTIDNFILYNSAEIIPDDLEKIGMINPGNLFYRRSVLKEAKKAYPDDPMRQVMYYDMKIFLCSLLDRNDLMTMRASIECRVPFLDYRLVEGLAATPSKDIFISEEAKSLLRIALGDRLPGELLSAKKWGFAVPWIKYYKEHPAFRKYLESISNHKLVIDYFKDPAKIGLIVNDYLNGDNSMFFIVYQLINICLWYDLNFEEIKIVKPVQSKRKSILYIGNFLSKHGSNPNFNLTLIPRLSEFSDIITVSDKLRKSARLFDMVFMFVNTRKKVDFVIIDVYSTDAFWYAYIIARIAKMLNIPYINMLHGGNLPKRLKNNKLLSRFLFGNALINISPSIYLKRAFTDSGFKVKYIPNFIPLEDYPFKESKSIKYRIFWLRAFHKIYNPTLAVRVIKNLSDMGLDAHLYMVGPDKDGSEKEVVNLAEKLKVSDRIKLTGRLNKKEWLRLADDSDIFINTTNFDNHPVSLIEAMALGFPIVSTNVGGLPYLIENGVNGILVPPDNAEAFTKAIIDLVDNPEKARVLGLNARKTAESFTWEVLRDSWSETLA